uniref:Uncharacterized protein n=1 Tax=Arundo donax TaxID=35708 RepID=A0A0A8YQJ4_ARUDO
MLTCDSCCSTAATSSCFQFLSILTQIWIEKWSWIAILPTVM